MGISVVKSDVTWKMGAQGMSSITYSERMGKKAPSASSCWLSKFVVLCVVSVHGQQERDIFSSDLTCCPGNADRVILWRWSLKEKKKECELHYCITLCSI